MAGIAIQDGRGDIQYCAIVWAMEGWGGVPKQRGCLQIIVLIPVQRPRTERISCKDHAPSRFRDAGRGARLWPLHDIVLLLVVCARVNRLFILPARLHRPHCCNTIARLLGHIRPPLDPPWVCHTPYNIGHYNIVQRPSQAAWVNTCVSWTAPCAKSRRAAPRRMPPSCTYLCVGNTDLGDI